jgi:hypothetical protein
VELKAINPCLSFSAQEKKKARSFFPRQDPSRSHPAEVETNGRRGFDTKGASNTEK